MNAKSCIDAVIRRGMLILYAVDCDATALYLVNAECRAHDLRPSRAHQSEKSEYFTFVKLDIHIFYAKPTQHRSLMLYTVFSPMDLSTVG